MTFSKLGEIASIMKGNKVDNILSKPTALSKRFIQIDDLRNDNNLKYTEGTGTEAFENDILIAWDGANAGTIGYGIKGIIGSTISLLRITTTDILPSYLGRFLGTKSEFLRNQCSGATIPHIRREVLEDIIIPIPKSKTEQVKIVALLDKADSIRKKRQESIRLADEFLRSTFLDMFGDPVSNKKSFTPLSLSEICTKITDGTHDTPERLKTGIKFITGKHIRAFIIDFDNSDYVIDEVHEEIYRRCNPQYGDILYTNIGVNLGTAAMNTVNYEFSMKNVALLKPNQNIVTSRFVEHTLNYQNMKDSILRSASLGGAQQFMSLSVINNIKFPIPPIELQKKFSSIVEQTETIKRWNNISLTESENLFNSLMQRAFKGEL